MLRLLPLLALLLLLLLMVVVVLLLLLLMLLMTLCCAFAIGAFSFRPPPIPLLYPLVVTSRWGVNRGGHLRFRGRVCARLERLPFWRGFSPPAPPEASTACFGDFGRPSLQSAPAGIARIVRRNRDPTMEPRVCGQRGAEERHQRRWLSMLEATRLRTRPARGGVAGPRRVSLGPIRRGRVAMSLAEVARPSPSMVCRLDAMI